MTPFFWCRFETTADAAHQVLETIKPCFGTHPADQKQ